MGDNTALQCSRMMKNKKLKRKEERDSRKIEFNTSRQIAKTLKTKKSKNSTSRTKGTKGRKNSKKKESKRKQLQRKRERQRIVKKKQRQRERQKKVREKKKRIRKEKKQSREEKKKKKKDGKIEKKITKLWRDWLPAPSIEIQNMLRLRMDDCNWKDFSDSGHSEDLQLIPRAAFQFGDIAQIIDPMLNPFNISSEDEDSEYEEDYVSDDFESRRNPAVRKADRVMERRFDSL